MLTPKNNPARSTPKRKQTPHHKHLNTNISPKLQILKSKLLDPRVLSLLPFGPLLVAHYSEELFALRTDFEIAVKPEKTQTFPRGMMKG